MKQLALVVMLFVVMVGSAKGAPPVSQDGCLLFTDMAIVARALAVEKIPVEKAAAVLVRIYDMPEPSHMVIASSVLRVAYLDTRPPADFARAFWQACVGQKLDGFLGVSA